MDHHLCLQLFPTVSFSTILLIFPEAWLYFPLPNCEGNLYICSIAFLITLGTTRSTTLPPSRNAWAILFSAILFYLRTSVEELVLRFKVVKEILTVSWPAYAKLHLFRNLPFLFFFVLFLLFVFLFDTVSAATGNAAPFFVFFYSFHQKLEAFALWRWRWLSLFFFYQFELSVFKNWRRVFFPSADLYNADCR